MEGVQIRLLQEVDIPAVNKLLHESFFVDEPLSSHLNVKIPIEVQSFSAGIIERCLNDGISLVAIEEQSGNCIGCRLSSIDTPDSPSDWPCDPDNPNDRKMKCIGEVMSWIHDGTDIFKLYDVDKYMHYQMLTISRENRQKGLAKLIVEESLRVARGKGVSLVVTVASSPYTIKLYRRLNYDELNMKYMKEFRDSNGNDVFAGMGDESQIMLFGKRI